MLWNSYHRKSCIKPPPPPPPPAGRGLIYFKHIWEGLNSVGGLIHLTQTMVLVLHRELEYKVEKLK